MKWLAASVMAAAGHMEGLLAIAMAVGEGQECIKGLMS